MYFKNTAYRAHIRRAWGETGGCWIMEGCAHVIKRSTESVSLQKRTGHLNKYFYFESGYGISTPFFSKTLGLSLRALGIWSLSVHRSTVWTVATRSYVLVSFPRNTFREKTSSRHSKRPMPNLHLDSQVVIGDIQMTKAGPCWTQIHA